MVTIGGPRPLVYSPDDNTYYIDIDIKTWNKRKWNPFILMVSWTSSREYRQEQNQYASSILPSSITGSKNPIYYRDKKIKNKKNSWPYTKFYTDVRQVSNTIY